VTYVFYRAELHPIVTPFSSMFIDVRGVFRCLVIGYYYRFY